MRSSRLPLILLVLAFTSAAHAQFPVQLDPPARVIPLYHGVAPGSEKWNWEEATFRTFIGNVVTRNVVQPTLQYYPADKAKARGSAVIILPGGGFVDLLMVYSGTDIAHALNAAGVDAFILKYRLAYTDPKIPLPRPGEKVAPPPPRVGPQGEILRGPQQGQNIYELDMADTTTALAWVRAHASEFGYKADHVGMIGFSAGAVLAHRAAIGPREARPDFIGLIYGTDESMAVPADAPPLFLAVASDDPWAEPLSLKLYAAWHAAKCPAELHVFQIGSHGFLTKGGGADHFMARFDEWMKANRF